MVNTFIPYSNFKKCAKVLDNKRLGKQRVEAKQIINILTNATDKQGWKNHVVTKMWHGYIPALKYYYNTIVKEWIDRGFENNMELYEIKDKIIIPWFVSNKSINMSHRASLLRKEFSYYKDKFNENPPLSFMKHKYIWISKLSDELILELKKRKDELVDIERFAEVAD
jgi:hypothetical protein